MALFTLAMFLLRLLFAEDGGEGGDGGDGGAGKGDGGDTGDGGDGGDGKDDDLDHWKHQARRHERESKAAAKRAKELEGRLAKLEGDSQSEHEKALEQAKKEAREEAHREAKETSNRRIVAAELKAAAGTKLADPSDAVRLLDLDEFEVDDEGELDDKAVSAAIDKLLKDKPYLAAKGGKKLDGDGDGGARGNTKNDDEVTPGMGRLRAAYAESGKK